MTTASAPAGSGAPVMIFQVSPRADGRGREPARRGSRRARASVAGAARHVLRAHRPAVHRGLLERREVDVGAGVPREHAPERERERDVLDPAAPTAASATMMRRASAFEITQSELHAPASPGSITSMNAETLKTARPMPGGP